jgi:hypothetical protein
MRLRTGRKVGRTLYLQISDVPSDDDILVGIVETRSLAELIVEDVNESGGVGVFVADTLINLSQSRKRVES